MGDLEEKRKRIRELLDKDPELKEMVINHAKEMRKPENLKPMVDSAVKLFTVLKELQNKRRN